MLIVALGRVCQARARGARVKAKETPNVTKQKKHTRLGLLLETALQQVSVRAEFEFRVFAEFDGTTQAVDNYFEFLKRNDCLQT